MANADTISIAVHANTELPASPAGRPWLKSVFFTNCPGDELEFKLIAAVSDDVNAQGVPRDSWWAVEPTETSRMPVRALRLTKGSHSLTNLLRRYGFQGADDCVRHRDVRLHYSAAPASRPELLSRIPESLRDLTGLPQLHRNSGNCWFTAMCGTSFLNPRVRDLILSRVSDPQVRDLCSRCLYDRDAAHQLRRFLWYTYRIGDNVEQRPELDGKNGAAEFSALCAHLKVPLLRFVDVQKGGTCLELMDVRISTGSGMQTLVDVDRTKPHLLMARFLDADNSTTFPVRRRLYHKGCTYRLVGFYGGSRRCSHQCGFAFPGTSWRYVVLFDADCNKDGIGPMHVLFDKGEHWKKNWWAAWRTLVIVTKYGSNYSKFCPLSPHNVPDDSWDGFRGATSGKMALDVLYESQGSEHAEHAD